MMIDDLRPNVNGTHPEIKKQIQIDIERGHTSEFRCHRQNLKPFFGIAKSHSLRLPKRFRHDDFSH